MIRLEVSASGRSAGSRHVDSFPCVVGRAAGCDLRLDAAGVWERHVEIDLRGDQGFQLRALSGGSVILNGEQIEFGRVRNGDRIDLGGLALRFWLTPVRARSNRVGDVIFWGICTAVGAAMIAMILTQPG
jgi:predicted component of type VI protein secretion system